MKQTRIETIKYSKKIHCDLCGHFEEKRYLQKDGGFYTKCSECGFVYTSPLTVDLTAHNDGYYKEVTEKGVLVHQRRDSLLKKIAVPNLKFERLESNIVQNLIKKFILTIFYRL